ncbi:MAG: ABC transporter permease, partial [bacterium]
MRGHSRLGAIVSLFRELILPYHRRHLFRMLLTLVGVVIGTQVVVAVQLLNRSVVGSFEATVETIAGSADLQITNASSGVPEEVVDEIFEVPGVASASGLLQGVLVMDDGELTVFGVDLFADQSVREAHFPPESIHIDDEFIFANARDSIAVALPFLAARGLGLGDTMDVQGPFGPATLTVRGALDPVGPAKLFGGAVAVVDLFVAQDLFVRKG